MTITLKNIPLGSPWEPGRALWVFGYGSLMYRVDFPIDQQVFGFIKGRYRAFLQKSHDHRGTPQQPGRVCTLLANSHRESVCWGVAYKVKAGMEAEVKELLDFREKDGYTIEFVSVFTKAGAVVCEDAVVYVGVSSNPSFAKDHESSIDATAQVIARAVGPSGSNREYLFKLIEALRKNGVEPEAYLQELEHKVRAIAL
ncbi:Cation transport regulator-like protein 2 [Coemansia aciculifera]|uniref:Cation transport regulator-like protein 2 n=1 Tax=Coemansia aciculifera TaxID=417176 RepID=A0ACC1M1F3_9FUNG|nr:Cation transport regulator-like protein 2 [Coemansia aciculifera]KAJ2910634.1 Cation transport regulator-like protein 2 [Coemansia aciculifera]